MYERLQHYFQARQVYDPASFPHVCSFFSPRSVSRNQTLIEPGQVCRHYYFVNKGVLRLFSLNHDGRESTRYFAFEGSFGTALPSLIDQKPAFEYLQAVESSELLSIGRDDFYDLVDTVPAMGRIYRQILEAAFITAQKRIYGFQNLEGIEKLHWLMEYQPGILTRISNRMAASYLGMTPSTLSRLKARL